MNLEPLLTLLNHKATRINNPTDRYPAQSLLEFTIQALRMFLHPNPTCIPQSPYEAAHRAMEVVRKHPAPSLQQWPLCYDEHVSDLVVVALALEPAPKTANSLKMLVSELEKKV